MAATDFKDYYSILGVSKTATNDEIKQAFRRLARKYHPDVNPGNIQAEAKFKEVNEAYEVLSDAENRRKYDSFGQYWKQAGQGWPSGGGGTSVGFEEFDFGKYGSFDEFLNDLLGGFGRTGASRSGTTSSQTYTYRTTPRSSGFSGFDGFGDFSNFDTAAPSSASLDTEASIKLSFAEAFNGVQKRISLGNEAIEVRIPPGAKPGSKIRVRGKGKTSPYNQQRGDLYLKVELLPHSFFQFEGDNLVCEVPITPDEAVLGAVIEVPTPDGSVKMNIPAGIRSGQTLRLRGKGWTLPKGGRSDQLVKIAIAPPKELTPTERECYEKIRDNRTFNPRSHLQQVTL
ncbi:DnaJ C-terminal domain-containing protein [Gloeocapsa sp. BRSZ]